MVKTIREGLGMYHRWSASPATTSHKLVTQYHIKQEVVDILVIPAFQRGRQGEKKSEGKLSYKESWSLVFKRLASE